jgi:hydrogenase/urease accessory protein HupE
MLKVIFILKLLLLEFCLVSTGQAHLLPFQNGTINIEGTSVFVAISVPVSGLHNYDDNKDGLISSQELQDHRQALINEIDARLVIGDKEDKFETAYSDLMINSIDSASIKDSPLKLASDQILVLKHIKYSNLDDLRSIKLNLDLFGTSPTEQQFTVKATRGLRPTLASEAAIFTPSQHIRRFFQPASETFVDYILLGIEHVLTGLDHLFFLLTIILAGTGLRYWLCVTSSFTIAHSITLALGLFGYIQISPIWVEPAIALSIVLMSMHNIYFQNYHPLKKLNLHHMIILVAGCGLLHGLGFASAITDIGLDQEHRLYSLLGFNLGIEIGQLIFISIALILFWCLHAFFKNLSVRSVKLGLSFISLLAGIYWLIVRLL